MRFPLSLEHQILDAIRSDNEYHIVVPVVRSDQRVIITRKNRSQFLHRWLFQQLVGRLSDKQYLVKKCDIDGCQNPYHWTVASNSRNVVATPRTPRGGITAAEINRAKTACPHGHLYTKANTYMHIDKRGRKHRTCRTCKLDRLEAARDRS